MTITRLEEIAHRRLVGEEDAFDIDGEVEVPFLVGDVDGAVHRRHAGIGDQDVIILDGFFDEREAPLDLGALADIETESEGAGTELGRRLLGRVQIEVGQHDPYPMRCERAGDGPADAGGAAGDDGGLAVEVGSEKGGWIWHFSRASPQFVRKYT